MTELGGRENSTHNSGNRHTRAKRTQLGTKRGKRQQPEVNLNSEMLSKGICLPERLGLAAGPKASDHRALHPTQFLLCRCLGHAAGRAEGCTAASRCESPFAGPGLVNPTEKSVKGGRSLCADREPQTDV